MKRNLANVSLRLESESIHKMWMDGLDLLAATGVSTALVKHFFARSKTRDFTILYRSDRRILKPNIVQYSLLFCFYLILFVW